MDYVEEGTKEEGDSRHRVLLDNYGISPRENDVNLEGSVGKDMKTYEIDFGGHAKRVC